MNFHEWFLALPMAAISDKRAESVARGLVEHAARNAPSSLSERLEEEWLADLATRQGRMAKLRFGMGCCWATRVIAHEHCAANGAVTAAATGPKIITAYAPHRLPSFSRRTSILLLIIGLHGFLIYALSAGLTHRLIDVSPQPLEGTVLPFSPVRTDLPPPTPLNFSQPVIHDYPTPLFAIDDQPVEPDANQAPAPQATEPFVPPSVPSRAVNRIPGGPGKGFPNTDDYYPSAARRMGEQGVAAVRVCVDERGMLTENPTLALSAGSSRLDEGALKLARAGSGHYRPSTEDGRPISSCYAFRIKYKLTD